MSVILTFLFLDINLASKESTLFSPDGKIRLKLTHGEKLIFEVSYKSKSIVEKSPMSFMIDSVDISNGVLVEKIQKYGKNETYNWNGVHSPAFNRCNGLRVFLKHIKSKTNYILEVRAYNNGIAFRFIAMGGDQLRVPDEATKFILPEKSIVWFHGLEGHYEDAHSHKDVTEIRDTQWVAPPMTYKLPDNLGYASITESALVNYAGMALKADGNKGFVVRLGHSHPPSYPYRLRYSKEDIKRLSIPASIKGNITTPWRIVMIGSDLNTLVNCDIINNLAVPPDKKFFPKGNKTDWIKPGRAVWKYLDGGENTLDEMKKFSKMAGELGFEHNIIEGFWRRWTDDEIKDLVNYSNQYHVGVWFWLHSKNLRDSVESRTLFEKLHKLGVSGVKIDFFDHEAKETIDQYQRLLRETAENKLLVDFHGANKPTGESRTWPNELTREGIRGMESSRLQDRATHETTLPFTRMLAGQAEYTVVHFGDRKRNTTWTHQVASAAILSAPCLTYAANPANILTNPSCEMIKSIPSIWDETIVLTPSEIGECAVYARRKGNVWFLAVMNGVNARTINLAISFLGKGEYNTLILQDEKNNPASIKVENKILRRADSITLDLVEGGGYIARFTKK